MLTKQTFKTNFKEKILLKIVVYFLNQNTDILKQQKQDCLMKKLKHQKIITLRNYLFEAEKIHLLFGVYNVLGQEKITYTHGSIVNLYVVHQRRGVFYNPSSNDHINDFLFGAGNYYQEGLSGYGISFCQNNYLHKNSCKNARNLLIIGAETKGIALALRKCSIKISGTITIEAKYELKRTCMIPNKRHILPVHYNGDDSYFFVNGVQQYKFKAKDSKIKENKLCLGNISTNLEL